MSTSSSASCDPLLLNDMMDWSYQSSPFAMDSLLGTSSEKAMQATSVSSSNSFTCPTLEDDFGMYLNPARSTRFHVAPQHKHKRVRSSSDLNQTLGLPYTATISEWMDDVARLDNEVTPMYPAASNENGPSRNCVINTTVPSDTEMKFHSESLEPDSLDTEKIGQDGILSRLQSFINDISWSDLPTSPISKVELNVNVNDTTKPSESLCFNDWYQPIGSNEEPSRMKRKRPPMHTRRHSNPAIMNQLQALHRSVSVKYTPPAPSIPFPVSNTNAACVRENAVPKASIHSGHMRQSSLPESDFQTHLQQCRPKAGVPHRVRKSKVRSTGLSMDLSHMKLDFLPTSDAMYPVSSFLEEDATSIHGNRKLYKCGRCGQPKVGHVCTMPDHRNNWTQIDLDVTKGCNKVTRTSCASLTVKTLWIPQHPDHGLF
ncbi:unnamed protein product [Albugo candida]|uniref:Uncharacterized protein n=1 Tax=Albugo candida TaxID=65357 RepID=A0A024GLG8_9STRA|nr:unnamed protein product [Albugo candida]|eukprot:CCI47187.1 unnamed protein product [Albugo candida]